MSIENSEVFMSNLDLEIVAITEISKVLSPIEDKQALERIIKWAQEKYAPLLSAPASRELDRMSVGQEVSGISNVSDREEVVQSFDKKEMPGIALVTDDGAFKLTLRDIKASSTKDAAIRLTLVSIYAHNLLTGSSDVSTKEVINPILKHWRAYDGNTRNALANHQGIVRTASGMLSLDYHATKDARQYIEEINDPSVEGRWKSNNQKKSTKKRGK